MRAGVSSAFSRRQARYMGVGRHSLYTSRTWRQRRRGHLQGASSMRMHGVHASLLVTHAGRGGMCRAPRSPSIGGVRRTARQRALPPRPTLRPVTHAQASPCPTPQPVLLLPPPAPTCRQPSRMQYPAVPTSRTSSGISMYRSRLTSCSITPWSRAEKEAEAGASRRREAVRDCGRGSRKRGQRGSGAACLFL